MPQTHSYMLWGGGKMKFEIKRKKKVYLVDIDGEKWQYVVWEITPEV
jgi:hypothetical protein